MVPKVAQKVTTVVQYGKCCFSHWPKISPCIWTTFDRNHVTKNFQNFAQSGHTVSSVTFISYDIYFSAMKAKMRQCYQIGRFLNLIGSSFRTKVAQISYCFLGNLQKGHHLSKICCSQFLGNCWKIVAIFHSNIRSHWRWAV